MGEEFFCGILETFTQVELLICMLLTVLGAWKDDMLDGHGYFYFGLGGYLFGTFSNNRVHGQAALCFPNNDFLIGFWDNGFLNGKVIRYFACNDSWVLCEYNQGIPARKIKDGKGQPPYGILLK